MKAWQRHTHTGDQTFAFQELRRCSRNERDFSLMIFSSILKDEEGEKTNKRFPCVGEITDAGFSPPVLQILAPIAGKLVIERGEQKELTHIAHNASCRVERWCRRGCEESDCGATRRAREVRQRHSVNQSPRLWKRDERREASNFRLISFRRDRQTFVTNRRQIELHNLFPRLMIHLPLSSSCPTS